MLMRSTEQFGAFVGVATGIPKGILYASNPTLVHVRFAFINFKRTPSAPKNNTWIGYLTMRIAFC